MLSTTLRATRPLRARMPSLATTQRRAQASATRLPLGRPSRPSIALGGPLQTTFRTQMSTKPPLQPTGIDREHEREVAQKKLEPRPDEVTSTSTVRQVIESSQAPPAENPDVMVGLKGDLNTIKDTFALASVPRDVYALGLAGTLPYLATSISTVFLSWNLNTDWPTQSHLLNSLMFDPESATHWLHLMEPIQVGYGAVIISFLGAIHWGLEFGEKQRLAERTRLRYSAGVLAPAVAWPTIFMPIEWALITQFGAFCALYFTDSRVTVRGWAPAWYGTYRFVLTAIVGAAIVISLVGRAKVGEGQDRTPTIDIKDRIRGRPSSSAQRRDWAREEEQERRKMKEEKKKAEEEEKRKKEEEEKAKAEEEKKQGKKGGDAKGDDKSDGKGKKSPGEKEDAAGTGEKADDQKKDQARDEGGAAFDEKEASGDKKESKADDN